MTRYTLIFLGDFSTKSRNYRHQQLYAEHLKLLIETRLGGLNCRGGLYADCIEIKFDYQVKNCEPAEKEIQALLANDISILMKLFQESGGKMVAIVISKADDEGLKQEASIAPPSEQDEIAASISALYSADTTLKGPIH